MHRILFSVVHLELIYKDLFTAILPLIYFDITVMKYDISFNWLYDIVLLNDNIVFY